ncbi:MAG: hypothetical protein H7840_00565 [Alphaproteobacteria bacterium]
MKRRHQPLDGGGLDSPQGGKGAIVAFLLAGLVGAVLGYVRTPISDVLFPAVYYANPSAFPPGNLAAIVYEHVYSAVPQFAAAILRAGGGPADVVRSLSVLQGVLYCQAMALLVFSLSGWTTAAVLAGLAFCWHVPFTIGTDYLIAVFEAPSTGIIALGLVLYATGLLAVGWWRGAGFVLGFLPAAHVMLGTWSLGVTAAAVLVTRKPSPPLFGGRGLGEGGAEALGMVPVAPPPHPLPLPLEGEREWVSIWMLMQGAAAGALLGLVLWAIKLWQANPDVVQPDPAPSIYLEAFLLFWDVHRNQVFNTDRAVVVVQAVLTLVALALHLRWSRPSPGARIACVSLIGGGAAAIAVYLLFHLLRPHLPSVVLVPLPNRLLNTPIAVTFAVTCGLLLHRLPHPLAAVGLVVTASLALAGDALPGDALPGVLAGPVGGCLAAALGVLGVVAARRTPPFRLPGRWDSMAAWLAGGVLATWIVVTGKPSNHQRANDIVAPLFANVPTPIAISDERTQRIMTLGLMAPPVLLDVGALDIIPYVPAIAPRVAVIMRDVYAIDYFNPPEELYGRAVIAIGQGGYGAALRREWEERSPDQWRALAIRHGFRSVACPGDWTLQLGPAEATLSLGRNWGGAAVYVVPIDTAERKE